MGKMEEGNKTFCHSYNTETTHFLLDRSEEKTDKSGTNFLFRTSCSMFDSPRSEQRCTKFHGYC